ncbi:MAG: transposase [Spirochaetes bacterium]|nr:transposase [Spirochaetota bacterium]
MKEYKIRKNNRLKHYDYSMGGWYFVTICAKDKKNIFDEYQNIVGTGLAPVLNENTENNDLNNTIIRLSKLGQIIEKQWNSIPGQNKNIELDQYVIMPNHIHGILIINKRTGASPVPTVSNIIGSFKSKTSVEYLNYVKSNNLNVSGQIWQRSFYDHVIRNEKSLHNIREYIINNPAEWETDKENKDSIIKKSIGLATAAQAAD